MSEEEAGKTWPRSRDVSVASFVNWEGGREEKEEGKITSWQAGNWAFVTHFRYICAEPRPRKGALPKRLLACRISNRDFICAFALHESLIMLVRRNFPMGSPECRVLRPAPTSTRGAGFASCHQNTSTCGAAQQSQLAVNLKSPAMSNERTKEREKQSNNDQSY